ncbi:surface-adhesin E family protein [Acidovorax sacchari]|uniref:surface-adhesin E family protein n=1 Tax=Acidovorax sacchari TaxID=3230736 RepID=UPI0039E52973
MLPPLCMALFAAALPASAGSAQPAPAQPSPTASAAGYPEVASRAGEWLTIHGFPEVPDGDLVQINPTAQHWQDQVAVDLRVSRSGMRINYRNVPYRSYQGMAVFDCVRRKGWYLSLQYYQEPLWRGPVTARLDFKEHEAPVTFAGMPGEPADKLVRAACRKR